MLRFLKIACILCMSTTLMFAQKSATDFPIAQKVEKAIEKHQLTEFTLVTTATTNLESEGIPKSKLNAGKLLDLNKQAISNLRAENPDAVSLVFPMPQQADVKVNLVRNKVLTPDFILRQSSNVDAEMNYTPGLYYTGTVEDDPSAMVSISVFDDEIIGMINKPEGNYVIGKLEKQNTNKHIIYKDTEIANPPSLDCSTVDDGVVYETKQLTFDLTKAVGDCVRVYIEIDDDIVSNKGGVTGATNYITGVMNEVITLYANDNLTMAISEILAWDTPAPYSGNSSSAMLSSYQSNTGSFNGDLSHLVSYQASGGIAAGFSGICNSNPDNSKCFSSIGSSFAQVPNYSFTVMVVTHEMGHLIGSRHTHACVWNGNGTAIDGCAGGTEGNCSLPGSPSNGGTIMSYCHLTTGIDFTQGFGPQPQAVILNSVANGSCLSGCAGPTCTDGIQNGNETGVDCGGPDCAPCNTNCNDNDVNVNITFDNYPEETSWTITNASGTTVASGGTYPSQPDGSSISLPFCLVDGCYDFNIFDSYGDGICCGYGNGSYSVTDGSGNVLAAGGSFTNSETTNFCFGGSQPIFGCTDPDAHNYDSDATDDDGSCETCKDGVQNGDETDVDCGGAKCEPCNTGGGSTVILGSFFETGWDGWSDGGSDCYRYSGSRSYEGNRSIRIRDNSGTASSMTTGAYNLSSYSSVDVEFYFYAYSMENGEDFWLQINNGSGWTTIASYARGTNFDNNTFYTSTVNTTNIGSNTQFRFRCDASGNNDHIYIDAVTITAYSGSNLNEAIFTIKALDKITEGSNAFAENEEALLEEDVYVYPNPVAHQLSIESAFDIEQISMYSASGKLIRTVAGTDRYQQIDVSGLTNGFYYISVKTTEGVSSTKFIKQ
ncbi:MAG: M12 family metallo-peptidase [Saprospiraceae bacterium]